jgi:hypothetical protein
MPAVAVTRKDSDGPGVGMECADMIRKFWRDTGRNALSAMVQMLVTVAFSVDLLFFILLGVLMSDTVESSGWVLAGVIGVALFAAIRALTRHIGPAA